MEQQLPQYFVLRKEHLDGARRRQRNFRKTRGTRQRHRYYRKFAYPADKFRPFFCTGCGRCSRACMAGIKLKETLSALAWGPEA